MLNYKTMLTFIFFNVFRWFKRSVPVIIRSEPKNCSRFKNTKHLCSYNPVYNPKLSFRN